MEQSKEMQTFPGNQTAHAPVEIDSHSCTGCNMCVNICPQDVFLPNPTKGSPPVIAFPEECWYEGICVETCPVAGTMKLVQPMMKRVRWKRKKTGEHFRL